MGNKGSGSVCSALQLSWDLLTHLGPWHKTCHKKIFGITTAIIGQISKTFCTGAYLTLANIKCVRGVGSNGDNGWQFGGDKDGDDGNDGEEGEEQDGQGAGDTLTTYLEVFFAIFLARDVGGDNDKDVSDRE